ncbi:hypothetical protein [Frigoriglobus tundricola]|uniref:Uncharacterized protein n=1 Tax=Frigoriglobus tundricola TaxID=2774151 RepID=A0A6M5YNR9_9BACT|nr:hypothetical protein [Frigoriglobus tundricola]QJW94612.1 hypothetical protein FTUN_2134 [Frigoriglobus tundricola]
MATEGSGEPPQSEVRAEIQGVLAKAKAGDASVLPQLREILDKNPSLVKHYGSLARHAEAAWIALAGGANLYMRESFARGAEARRAELTRPGASAVEKLLVERVVACDLQLGYLTTAEADALGMGDSYRQAEYHARRVERAQRMQLAALGALVTYQRLVPAVAIKTPTAVAAGQEEQAPDRARTDASPQMRLMVEVDAETHETTREEREPVRVGAG